MKQALLLIHCAIIIVLWIFAMWFAIILKWDAFFACVAGTICNMWLAKRALCYDTYYKVKVFTDPETGERKSEWTELKK